MKKNILAIAVSTMVAAPAFSQDNINPFADEKSGFYLGGALGAAELNDAYDEGIGDVYDATNAPYKYKSITTRTGIAKIFGGYRVNKYLALEADIYGLGDADARNDFGGNSNNKISTEVENKISGYSLKAVGFYPINKSFELKASAGVTKWKVEEDSNSSITQFGVKRDVGNQSKTEKGTSLVYGVGANYNINDSFTIGLQWERLNDIGDKKLAFGETDIDTYTASFQYNF